jgi:hypothetical protein
VSFKEIELSPDLLAKLGLPGKLDDKHTYHYRVLQHTGDESMLISRSYQHLHESFLTEVLIVANRMFLLERKLTTKRSNETWTYTLAGIELYANLADGKIQRSELEGYMHDLLAYIKSQLHPRVSTTASLEICEENAHSERALENFSYLGRRASP